MGQREKLDSRALAREAPAWLREPRTGLPLRPFQLRQRAESFYPKGTSHWMWTLGDEAAVFREGSSSRSPVNGLSAPHQQQLRARVPLSRGAAGGPSPAPHRNCSRRGSLKDDPCQEGCFLPMLSSWHEHDASSRTDSRGPGRGPHAVPRALRADKASSGLAGGSGLDVELAGNSAS